MHAGKFVEAAGVTISMQLVSFNATKLVVPTDSWDTVKVVVRSTAKPWEFAFKEGTGSVQILNLVLVQLCVHDCSNARRCTMTC